MTANRPKPVQNNQSIVLRKYMPCVWVKRGQATLWRASCQPGEAGRAYS
jgi:hypothetical protein